MIKEALRVSKIEDEYYTPIEAINPILKYLKPKSKILCPFDKEWSNYAKILSNNGHEVRYSHIENKDFMDYTKDNVKDIDYIISNPPFSIKTKILRKLFELDKPFLMLLPLTTLEGKERGELFRKYGIDLIIFDQRVNFLKGKSNWFNSSYFTWKVIDKQDKENHIIFEALNK